MLRVALTFDDGPAEWTEPLLDVFAEHGGRGTFFVLGYQAEMRPDIVRRMWEEGHEIGNHGYTHRAMGSLTLDEVRRELVQTAVVLSGIIPSWSRLWRAPHHSKNPDVLAVASSLNLAYVGTNLDPGDWKKDADGIEAHIRSDVREGSVINLHDGAEGGQPTRAPTVEAVRRLLADGTLESVTVSELWSAR